MARVDAYLRARSDSRDISLGGRSANSSIDATLNSDNATQSDCALNVELSVVGDRSLNGNVRKTCCSCSHKWRDGVKRGGVVITPEFHAELPKPGDRCPHCDTLRQ